MQYSSMHPMDRIKEQLRIVLKAIPQHSTVYYIDYPIHSNGGDLLIMKGTEAFFKDYNIRVKARYHVDNFPLGISIPEDCIIALHGGGNFGDLYVPHQRIREAIVKNYPNNRIVVMPQTIYFQNEDNYNRTAELFNSHNDLHIFVRDECTYELAVKKFTECMVYLSPDMAHQLWPISTKRPSNKGLLCFYRTDKESVGEHNETVKGATYKDWNTLFSRLDKRIVRLFQVGGKGFLGATFYWRLWKVFSDYLVQKAIKEFLAHGTIETSRLHGHILSCLLDQPNRLLDNSYGKNSNYYNTWTNKVGTAELKINQTKSDKVTLNGVPKGGILLS